MRRWRDILGILVLSAGVASVGMACVGQAVIKETRLSDPRAALRWRPNDGEALADLADMKARSANSDVEWRAATRLARRALVDQPLATPALRVLAWDADRRGQAGAAFAIMSLAGRLTQRDNRVHGWLLQASLARKDWRGAFADADAMLRREPELGPGLYPSMIASLGDPAARQAMVERLAWRPEWRTSFLSGLAGASSDLTVVCQVFDAVNASRAPLSRDEAGLLVQSILAAGDYRRARLEWRRLLPPAERNGNALLYDGGFRGLPGLPPFGWRFAQSGGASADLGTAPDGAPGLHIQYPDARERLLLSQTLVLEPGAYRFTGQIRYGHSSGGDQLVWRLQCVGGDATLLEARPAAAPNQWRSFSDGLTVPPEGCPAEILNLSSLPQDSFGVSEAWIRNLAMRAAPQP